MFGSLVIVFPTHLKGGALFLRPRSHEWTWIFNTGRALAGLDRPSIGYAAFLNNLEQGVSTVTSGHCVTLTYNLYFDDDGGPVTGKDAVSEILVPPKPSNQNEFREAFKALLGNPEFMADGGTLAFGLRHGYPIEGRGLQQIYNLLKGSDVVVYQCVRALGFEPMLYMYYGETFFGEHEGMVTDEAVRFPSSFLGEDEGEDADEDDLVRKVVEAKGDSLLRRFSW